MATKLDLLKLFSTGQGVAGGLPNYVNYPSDHDTNYTAVETTVNQMIDEINAARLTDSSIPVEMLQSDEVTEGRYSAEDAAVTRPTATTVTVSSGPIYVGGRRVVVVGQTFDFTGLTADATMFINTDENGLLTLSTTPAQAHFDLVNVNWDGATLLDTDVVDNIYNNGETLNNIKHGYVQESGEFPGSVTDVDNVDYPGRLAPPIRHKSKAGVINAAGLFAGDDNVFGRVSGLDSSNDTVLAEIQNAFGQTLLMEQARCIATATAQAAGTSGGLAALTFDAAVRREPASYFTNPWFTGTGNTFTQPGATAAERSNFIGTYVFHGYVQFPDALSTGPFLVDVVADGVTVFNARVAKVAGGITTVPISGFFELADTAANTIQVRTAHSAAGGLSVDARFGFMMIGGPTDYLVV